ncbi:hypothetical protein C1H46_013030 [Malus baccata]|uniref:Uncharacterized protein n=1 Tax=Malus baccata TaxID=106549 RepID=A0A540MSL2_MALBA|nr:hypothetical protein C1H46_013030 [Malus baccata]
MAMAVEKKKKGGSWRLQSGQYLGEISALCFLHLPSPLSALPYLLAGSGSQIMVYDLEMGRMGSVSGSNGDGDCLAIGCSDNSVLLWDVLASSVVLQLRHPERTLLYSMRLWGDTVQALHVAFGTIYNEIIVWKVASQYNAASLSNQVEDGIDQINSFSDSYQPHACQYEAVHIRKLVGHEGSIFWIAWSFDGTKLVSVSDDLLVSGRFVRKQSILRSQETPLALCCLVTMPEFGTAVFLVCKSEYVRRLHFACEDTLYVSTNHGYLYLARLLDTGEVEWTELVRLSEEVQIVCMDLFSEPLELCSNVEDWVAVGDGKGNVTIVGVICDACTPKVGFSHTWSAGMEQQLLGTHWSKSLGSGYFFTADPRGTLRLWKLSDHSARSCNVSLIAEFTSSFGTRIMCLDALLDEEVLVCGDIHGNLVFFPLLKSVLHGTVEPNLKVSPSNYFKGAHGISSVSSLAVARLSSKKIEIHSTGADGCIFVLEYERDMKSLEFIGMKQVKELSLIESVSADNSSVNELSTCHCAAGFASVDFVIWNLMTETKMRSTAYSLDLVGSLLGVKMELYTPGVENWSASKLLGEHVGGSAVRSICCSSKLYIVPSDTANINGKNAAAENRETPVLLISVGAKRVFTSWLLRSYKVNKKDETLSDQRHNITGNGNKVLLQESTSMSFQWLSTDMPVKYSSNPKFPENVGNDSTAETNAGSRLLSSEKGNIELKSSLKDKYEDDWRYLAVTAFLVKCAGSMITVCFIVVACSDATLALRALVLPYRLWFDVAVLLPLASPVLAFQHVILPTCVPSEDNIQMGSMYILISGATDGSIALWDLMKSIQAFVKLCQYLITVSSQAIDTASEVNAYDSSSDIYEISPLAVFENIHQSGVNSLHVSGVEGCRSPEIGFLYNLISGGDDQALSCLTFELFVNHDKVPSAHSSVVKGVWTDGSWVFSTGLDQRVRCWRLEDEGKLIEGAYFIISVPEPEALDAKLCGRNHYQIAVAGRGMQMLEFSESSNVS